MTLDYTVEVGGRRFEVRVSGRQNGTRRAAAAPRRPRAGAPRRERAAAAAAAAATRSTSPMQGTVLQDRRRGRARSVEPGALVAIVEAMKMENEITAHKAGTVAALPIAVGASVAAGDVLAVIESL